MVGKATSGSKLVIDSKSQCIGNIKNLKEVKVKRREVSEKETFFRITRDIQGLDIVLSLQNLGCYVLPYRSMFNTINFIGLFKKLARRKPMFLELVTQGQFKKLFGLYGYKILNLCLIMSLEEFVSENRYSENIFNWHITWNLFESQDLSLLIKADGKDTYANWFGLFNVLEEITMFVTFPLNVLLISINVFIPVGNPQSCL